MKIAHNLNNLKRSVKRSVVAVGVFDGVHKGHQAIIKKVVRRSRLIGARSILVTFDPHPLKILKPSSSVPTVISLAHRVRLAKELGIDKVIVLKFTKALSRMSAEDFMRTLIEKLGLEEIYVGENFYFGKRGLTGARELSAMAERLGFKAHIIRSVRINGEVVSSSRIRALIAKGDINKAALFLGRKASVLGTVVSGAALARELGYPTANIDPHHEAIPPAGVYAVRIKCGRDIYKGVLNIGTRPTFFNKGYAPEPVIEAHIFNFKKDIYGRDLEVFFIKKLREERKFQSVKALIAQIKMDEYAARRI